MVASCSICGEQYGVTEDVTFHKFPANEERRKKWLAALQRGAWTPGKRSMLCSNHFSRDKFIHKISGDKIRRYLKPDTVPTIFDRTKGKLKIRESRQLDASNEASSSNLHPPANATATECQVPNPSTDNSSRSLNLEILAETSVASEPYSVPMSPSLNTVGKNTADAIFEPIETPFVSAIAVAGSSANSWQLKAKKPEDRGPKNPAGTKKSHCKVLQIQTDLTLIPKQNRQVYSGDFKHLKYNDGPQVSKSLTALNNCVKKMRSNMKVLRQRNRRLEKRVADLKEVIKFLKNRIVTRDSHAVGMSGSFGLPVAKKAVPKGNRVHRLSEHLKDHDYFSLKNKPTF